MKSGLEFVHERLREIAHDDEIVAGLLDRYGFWVPEPPEPNAFGSLIRHIAYQQLAGRAAAAIFGRLREKVGEVTPSTLAALSHEDLRSCGLSGAKSKAILDVTARVGDGRLRLDQLSADDPEGATMALCEVYGIGPWKAHMFLIFDLGHVDVWPVGDLGVRQGYSEIWGLDEVPAERGFAQYGAPYVGVRSAIAQYCWYVADGKEPGDPTFE